MSMDRNEQLEIVNRLVHEGKIDRRRLFQTAAALGLTTAGVGAAMASVRPAAAQDSGAKLVTISQEQTPTWVRNFNPLLTENSSRWPCQSGIYEPMAIFNLITAELTPWLATEWKFSDDNKQLTFTLRDGVKWSDGEVFDSADVKYTFDLLMSNEAIAGTGGIRSILPIVSAVDAPDPKTVVFTFTEVNTLSVYDIGEQTIVAEHIWKDVPDPLTFTNENPVATGPFTNVTKFEAQYWELQKNPNYWQEGKPYIDGFRFPAYPTNDAANLATLNGENDWAANFIPDIEKTFIAKDPEHHHYWFPPTGATVHMYMNTTMAPFDDPNVRKAFSMAIDRDQIVAVAMYDYTHPADSTGLSDAFTKWKDEAQTTGAWVKRDVDAANAALDAAGLMKDGDTRKTKDGKPMEYELNVVTGWSDWVSSCQIMAKNFEDIGVKVTVKDYDVAAFVDRVQKGDFAMTIGWAESGPTPLNFYRGIMAQSQVKPVGESSGQNWHRYAGPGVDDLLAQFSATASADEQLAIAKQLQAIYNENAPAAPLFPGPAWGEFTTFRFTDFPSADNPYAPLPTWEWPERLITMTTIKPIAS